jgi:hypothetical protein
MPPFFHHPDSSTGTDEMLRGEQVPLSAATGETSSRKVPLLSKDSSNQWFSVGLGGFFQT